MTEEELRKLLENQNKAAREEINAKDRARLTNKDFSLIASNCNGSFMLKDLGLPFLSPFINLYLTPRNFIKYLSNIEHYLNAKLRFIIGREGRYPIGYLDDVEIHFFHYHSEEEAYNKWMERSKRLNLENFFVTMAERDGCRYQDLKNFDALPIKNKVVFTHRPYPEIASTFYIPGFEIKNEVGVLLDFSGVHGERYYDHFDYVKWFNGIPLSEIKAESEWKYL